MKIFVFNTYHSSLQAAMASKLLVHHSPLRSISATLPLPSWPSFAYAAHAAGRYRTVSTAASGREDLLRGVATEHRDEVARILELAERAEASWTVLHTPFHTPPVVADALAVLGRLADMAAVPWGGYPQAERCRIAVGREDALGGAAADPAAALDSVAALKVTGNFLFDPATHRDFLGAFVRRWFVM